jgi:hypothetical protein
VFEVCGVIVTELTLLYTLTLYDKVLFEKDGTRVPALRMRSPRVESRLSGSKNARVMVRVYVFVVVPSAAVTTVVI